MKNRDGRENVGERRGEHREDPESVVTTGGEDGTQSRAGGGLIDRRRFLVAAATPAVTALAGCPGTVDQTFSATPVVLPEPVLSRRDYGESSVESITTERSGSVAGIDFEATLESHIAAYARTEETDGPARYPGVGVFSTPNAAIEGNSINPLATEPLQSILAGEVVPEARTEVLSRLSDITGGSSWVRGPSPIETGDVTGESSGPSADFLGEPVEIATFGGIVRDELETQYAVLVFLARRTADDVAIFASVLDRPLEEGTPTDRQLVGTDAYFTGDQLAGGLSVAVDLLPLFQVQSVPSTPTNTPTATPTPTPSGGGTGTVIDNFEDGNTSEYRPLGIVNSSFPTSPTVSGSRALQFTNMYANYGIESTSGLPNYPHQGDQFRAWFRFESSPQPDQGFDLEFGNDANGRSHLATATKQASGDWEVRLSGNGSPSSGSFSTPLSAKTWYAFDVSWGPGTIELELVENRSGRVLGSTSVPATGDNGDDHIAFKAYPRQQVFLWDYAVLTGSARSGPNMSFPLVIDDFEDGNRSEYRQLGIVNASFPNSPTINGSRALQLTNMAASYGLASDDQSTGQLPHYPHQGDLFRAWFRFEDPPSQGERFTLGFGRDGSGRYYSASVEKNSSGLTWNVDLRSLGSGQSSSFTATLSTSTWYAFDISWKPGDIDLDLIDGANTSVGSTSIPNNGDNGDDHIRFEALVDPNHTFLWDYAHIAGWARNP